MTNVAAESASDIRDTGRITPLRNHVPGELSMWFFVIGDLLIFGVYFIGYVYYRGQDANLFLESQARLNLDIGAINTVILLTSSLFVALGTSAARNGKVPEAIRLFVIAFALGVAFPVMKAFEYVPEVTAGLTPGTNLFFMYYYVMTGLHLCHVMLGLVILGFVIRSLRISARPKMSFVETAATYWHMVDLLWILLFALLYLMR
ncbi:cytochrome c oxidase subunit 3 [Mycobacterium sp. 29Ha]|uniref:cytochrome c oxidase subunit 3 n=1 Tax=Mycobacterium sp. 29Ha TaxID=2939268 RepID=UPI0029392496|nr:cytochrome c oxidase subunit 3 [Mycobacterium sp. 29Ha]MDV3130480.1 cytochrome c oxidase subunit 3 [Mycobacterium sp. 29Ha]